MLARATSPRKRGPSTRTPAYIRARPSPLPDHPGATPLTTLTFHAALVLIGAFSMSIVYELWRATAKAGVSRHDTMSGFVLQVAVLYLPATLLIAGLLIGWPWAPVATLVFTTVMILTSLFYYNPVIMIERQPALIDWLEDLAFTGLLFVAAALLAYEVMGFTLTVT